MLKAGGLSDKQIKTVMTEWEAETEEHRKILQTHCKVNFNLPGPKPSEQQIEVITETFNKWAEKLFDIALGCILTLILENKIYEARLNRNGM